MRLHVPSLPHTATTREFSACAYTQKVRHFADMMTAEGHDVFLYAAEENEAACAELVTCGMPGEMPEFEPDDPQFAAFNARAIPAISERLDDERDLICIIGGTAQKPIADAFPNNMAVEWGVGYGGVFAPYRVFESYAWMHTVYGALTGGNATIANGCFYDAVIPNSFDPVEFPLGDGDGGYLLYVGRLIDRKGVQVAIETADAAGMPLHVAGHGQMPPGSYYYHGVVGPEQRAELMGGAVALIAPTLYVEPFGGVNVEAQMCGTPAITTDWGAFTETVEPEWRCRTLAEFVDAARRAADADRVHLRERALERYSTEVIGPQYDRYFNRLAGLWDDGWYA
jgi:glycosyltransferase involved in cell wall biosynthesis